MMQVCMNNECPVYVDNTDKTKKCIWEKDQRHSTTRYSARNLQQGGDNTGDDFGVACFRLL